MWSFILDLIRSLMYSLNGVVGNLVPLRNKCKPHCNQLGTLGIENGISFWIKNINKGKHIICKVKSEI